MMFTLLLLLLSALPAYASTTLRLGGLTGSYYLHIDSQRMTTRDSAGYIGFTTYLDYPSVGFTGSYSIFTSDKFSFFDNYPYERSENYYRNHVALLKVMGGFRFSGFTVGGGWMMLKHSIRGDVEPYTFSGPIFGVFTSSALSPQFNLDFEAFIAPNAEFLGVPYGVGGGIEARCSQTIIEPVSIEAGFNAVGFTLSGATVRAVVGNSQAFAGIKVKF